MSRLAPKRSRKAGLPPGTPVHIGEKKSEVTRIRFVHYDKSQVVEKELDRIEDGVALRPGAGVTWVHVTGVHDVALLAKLGQCFGLHPLVLEDISNTDQRPKLEEYGEYVYLVLKALADGADGREIVVEQVSFVVGPDFVLSFEEAEPTQFEPVRVRLREDRGGIRAQGADYLAYSLIDTVVDQYFLVIERFGDRIEVLHEDLLSRAPRRAETALLQLRREAMVLRRSLWPLREVLGAAVRGGVAPFQPATIVYVRDVYDHVVHMIDTLESFREMLANLKDLYLLNATNRLNEVIKVLTIIATVFSPPMLIASLYGMNFKFMPELTQPWGYPAALGAMTVTAVAMLLYFRRKKWI